MSLYLSQGIVVSSRKVLKLSSELDVRHVVAVEGPSNFKLLNFKLCQCHEYVYLQKQLCHLHYTIVKNQW